MAGNGTTEPISESEEAELEETLQTIRTRVVEDGAAATEKLDERSLKPMQKLLSQEPCEAVTRLLDYGLAGILADEFDLDWVRSEHDGQPQVVLQIPFSDHLIFPSTFFSEPVRAGKLPNVRTTYLHWSDWINDHQFEG